MWCIDAVANKTFIAQQEELVGQRRSSDDADFNCVRSRRVHVALPGGRLANGLRDARWTYFLDRGVHLSWRHIHVVTNTLKEPLRTGVNLRKTCCTTLHARRSVAPNIIKVQPKLHQLTLKFQTIFGETLNLTATRYIPLHRISGIWSPVDYCY